MVNIYCAPSTGERPGSQTSAFRMRQAIPAQFFNCRGGLVHLAWHDRGTPATVKSTTAAQPTGVPPGRRRRMCRGVTASLRRRCWLQRHTIGISSGFTIELADSRFSTNGAYFVAKPREKIDTSRGFLRRTVEAHEAMSLRLRRLRIVGSNGASPLIKRAR